MQNQVVQEKPIGGLVCASKLLPEILWIQIFKYCDMKEFIKMKLLSKSIRKFTENYKEIYERECLRMFTSNLPLFSIETLSVSEDLTFPFPLDKSVDLTEDIWQKLMEEGGYILKDWTLINANNEGIISKSTLAQLRNFMFYVLKDPPLPLPELEREEFNVYKKTILQEHLYQQIFKESSSSMSMSMSMPVYSELPLEFTDLRTQLEEVLNSLSVLLSEISMENEKQNLLVLRWYNFPSKSTSNSEAELIEAMNEVSINSDKAGKSAIYKLIYSLLKTISFFCKLCKNCILRNTSTEDIIGEYCKRWFGFCGSMIELDKTLESLTSIINKCYETLFPEFPRYPKFSFSRAMITMWKTKVFAKLKPKLFESFNALLASERRTELLKGKEKYGLDYSSAIIVAESGSSSRKDSEITVFSKTSASDTEGLEYSDFPQESRNCSTLSRFAESVADLSINELTIHFLGSTQVDLDEPYEELSYLMLKQSKKYYKKLIGEVQTQGYKEMLEKDYTLAAKLMLPYTLKKVKELQQKCMQNCVRSCIDQKFEQYSHLSVEDKKMNKGTSERKYNELYRYIKELTSEADKPEEAASDFYQYLCENEEKMAAAYQDVMENRSEVEFPEDLQIAFMNKKRNIPRELSPEEKLLYKYSQDITYSVLEGIRMKYEGVAQVPEMDAPTIGSLEENKLDLPQLIKSQLCK